MFTKAYKYISSLGSTYFSETGARKGYYLCKSTSGYEYYIGKQSSDGLYVNFYQTMNPASSSIYGYAFSTDPTPFVDDGSVYLPSIPRNVSYTKSLRSSSVVNGKVTNVIRYSVTNNNSESLTFYKLVASFDCNYASSFGGSLSSSSTIAFLGYVQELPSPVTVPAGGTAIIDVTFETEIPE